MNNDFNIQRGDFNPLHSSDSAPSAKNSSSLVGGHNYSVLDSNLGSEADLQKVYQSTFKDANIEINDANREFNVSVQPQTMEGVDKVIVSIGDMEEDPFAEVLIGEDVLQARLDLDERLEHLEEELNELNLGPEANKYIEDLQQGMVNHSQEFAKERKIGIEKPISEKIARKEILEEIVKNHSVEITQEKMEQIAGKFYDSNIRLGAFYTRRDDGRRTLLTKEEAEKFKTEFTSSLIVYLSSRNLIKIEDKSAKKEEIKNVKDSSDVKVSISTEKNRSDPLIDHLKAILESFFPNLSKIDKEWQLLEQSLLKADQKIREEKKEAEFEQEQHEIIIMEITKFIDKREVLNSETLEKITKVAHLIEKFLRSEAAKMITEEVKVSADPDAPRENIVIDKSREKIPT